MEFRNLSEISIEAIVDCFHTSFSDYFVPIKATVDFWYQRWKRARVDYSISFGVFDKEQLAGFILHGIEGNRAFNVGTGVIPAYRGKRLVNYMYETGLPLLKARGVNQCGLEVITLNDKAIKAYSRTGFTISRDLKCFGGIPEPKVDAIDYSFELKPDFNWDSYRLLQQYPFSWENTENALKANSKGFEAWELRRSNTEGLNGYVILNRENGYIAQFGAHASDYETNARLLFREIRKLVPTVKIHNVDARALQTLKLLEEIGLKNEIDQYEMTMTL